MAANQLESVEPLDSGNPKSEALDASASGPAQTGRSAVGSLDASSGTRVVPPILVQMPGPRERAATESGRVAESGPNLAASPELWTSESVSTDVIRVADGPQFRQRLQPIRPGWARVCTNSRMSWRHGLTRHRPRAVPYWARSGSLPAGRTLRRCQQCGREKFRSSPPSNSAATRSSSSLGRGRWVRSTWPRTRSSAGWWP